MFCGHRVKLDDPLPLTQAIFDPKQFSTCQPIFTHFGVHTYTRQTACKSNGARHGAARPFRKAVAL
jgi:hypothetical protein